MKKFLLIAVIIGAMLSIATYAVCVAKPLLYKGIKGSGELTTRTMDAPSFDAIRASRGVKVVVTDKLTDKITIEADDNVMNLVVVKVEGDVLRVGIDKSVNSISNFHVTVAVPANGRIRSLKASSGADIIGTTIFTASEFEMNASSGGSIRAAVKAGRCDLDVSSGANIEAAIDAEVCEMEAASGADIEVKGKANKCDAKASSAGNLSAQELLVGEYVISVSSGASARINCTEKLQASASSGASIRYDGDCSADINRSSGGSVRKN